MNRTTMPAHLVAAAGSRLIAGLLLLVLSVPARTEPRIEPLPESQWSDAQRRIADSIPGRVTNAVATYLRNPVLARDILPFEGYIASESTLPARHRELLALRTAWLCRSSYVWAHRAQAARRAGLTDEELQAVARGPDSPGWNSFDAALLRAADELHVDSFISDRTWSALAERYTAGQLLDLVFTVGEFTMIAGAVNSLGVEIESDLSERLPYAIPYTTAAEWTNERLIGKQPRIAPLERDEWTPEIRRLLDPSESGRRVANVYRTYVHNLRMDLLRRGVSEHIRDATTLSDRQREILLIRIGVLCRSEYEWSAHSRIGRSIGMTDADIERVVAGPDHATGDPVEHALLRATDELYRDDRVSDETWAVLDEALDAAQLLDMLVAVGGYRMFSMAINTFGVQLDPNAARFPPHLR